MSRTLLVAIMMVAGTSVARADDEATCLAGRAQAKAKYEQCIGKWLNKVYGGAPANDAKLAKCRGKYAAAWAKLQGVGTTCSAASRWTDNGDGTVSDHLTDLQWEQKTDDDSIHDKDNVYSWSAAAPWSLGNGTVYTDFLTTLNGGAGFAGANDWRVPTFAELLTILVADAYPCTTSPCIDAVFGPNQPYFYWTSSTFKTSPPLAWAVFLPDGSVNVGMKSTDVPARAVRGGL